MYIHVFSVGLGEQGVISCICKHVGVHLCKLIKKVSKLCGTKLHRSEGVSHFHTLEPS